MKFNIFPQLFHNKKGDLTLNEVGIFVLKALFIATLLVLVAIFGDKLLDLARSLFK